MQIKQKEREIISGNQIVNFTTIGSMFARDNIRVSVKKENEKYLKEYRMNVTEILKFNRPIKYMIFSVNQKKVWGYLEVVI